ALACKHTRIHIATYENDVNLMTVYILWDESQCPGTNKFIIFFQKQLFGGSHQANIETPIRENGMKLLLHADCVYFIRINAIYNRIIFTGKNGDCERKPYYQLLTANGNNQPEDWGYNSSMWQLEEYRSPRINSGLTGLTKVSEKAKNRKFNQFCIGTKRGNYFHWVKTGCNQSVSLKSAVHGGCTFDQETSSNNASFGRMVNKQAWLPPDFKENVKYGFNIENRIRFGFVSGKRDGGEYQVGMGLGDNSKTGYVTRNAAGAATNHDSTVHWVLGPIEQPVINPLKITETWQDSRKCSFGQKYFTYSCLIPNNNKFYAELCPGQSYQEQIYKECPFVGPVNLKTIDRGENEATLSWDVFDKSRLLRRPDKFWGYRVIVYTDQPAWTEIQRHELQNTFIKITGLSIFTHYKVELQAKVLERTVYGDSTELIFHTRNDVPVAAPTLTSTMVDHQCVKLQWTSINENDLKGYLIGYKITTLRNGTLIGTRDVNITNNETICNLLSYTVYHFTVQVTNEDHSGPASLESSSMTDQSTPTAPPLDVQAVANNLTIDHLGIANITIKWGDVPTLDRQGIILGYKIFCYDQNKALVDEKTFNETGVNHVIMFENLVYFSDYWIDILAFTGPGDGFSYPQINWTSVRTEGNLPKAFPISNAYNTSATSLMVEWEDLSAVDWSGSSEGFTIWVIKNETNKTVKTKSLSFSFARSNNFTHEFTGLEYFTIYKIQIAGYNRVEKGPRSSLFCRTEEAAPEVVPEVTQIEPSLNTTNLIISFPAPPALPGIFRGYTVYVSPVYKPEDFLIGHKVSELKSRKRRALNQNQNTTNNINSTNGGFSLPNTTFLNSTTCCTWNRSLTDNIWIDGIKVYTYNRYGPSENELVVDGLNGNTEYHVNVSLNTKFVGVHTPGVIVKTDDGVPLYSAFDVKCQVNGPYSFDVNWIHSSLAYTRGTRTHYRIYYQIKGNQSNPISYEVQEDPDKNYLFITRLEFFTSYLVWITAWTKAGEGNRTQAITCKSGEYFPATGPIVTADNYQSPSSINVTWSTIDQWNGIPAGYFIYYRLISLAGNDVIREEVEIFSPKVDQRWIVLEGLEVYGMYKVQVAGKTGYGIGRKSDAIRVATCRIPGPIIEINYYELPPYVYTTGNSQTDPDGLITGVASQSIVQCALTCTSFNESIKVVYKKVRVANLSAIDTRLQLQGSPSFLFPRFEKGGSGNQFFELIQSPGPLFIEVPPTTIELEEERERHLIDSIFNTLPLILLYALINAIFGCIFFFLEPTDGEDKRFPLYSLHGLFEGFYFAFITSTTVGYGDKVPNTFLGRVFIVIWTLLGIILTSYVVGNLTSNLSSYVIKSKITKVPEGKVIAVQSSYEYKWAERNMMGSLIKDHIYHSHDELVSELQKGDFRYGIIDAYIAEYYSVPIIRNGLKIRSPIGKNEKIGIKPYGEYIKLKSCISQTTLDQIEFVQKAVNDMKDRNLQTLANDKDSDQKSTSKLEDDVISMISPNSKMFIFVMKMLGACFGVFFIAGCIYTLCRSRMRNKENMKVHTDSEMLLQKQASLRQEWRQLIDQWKHNIHHFENFIQSIDLKHAREMRKYTTDISKIIGVNFRYVKLSELPVPMSLVMEFKEVEKQKTKLNRLKTRMSRNEKTSSF
uniref:Fibronectin type-III domain-containing protein n=3 Tax=Clytia hemisphaerica TaxID=252671 RepID=A0A7M5XJA9_9CNID